MYPRNSFSVRKLVATASACSKESFGGVKEARVHKLSQRPNVLAAQTSDFPMPVFSAIEHRTSASAYLSLSHDILS
jgi:hypothetical protein